VGEVRVTFSESPLKDTESPSPAEEERCVYEYTSDENDEDTIEYLSKPGNRLQAYAGALATALAAAAASNAASKAQQQNQSPSSSSLTTEDEQESSHQAASSLYADLPDHDDDDPVFEYSDACERCLVTAKRLLKDGSFSKTTVSTIRNFGAMRNSIDVVEKVCSTDKERWLQVVQIMDKVAKNNKDSFLRFYGSHNANDGLRFAVEYMENGTLLDNLKRGSSINGVKLDAFHLIDVIAGITRGMRFLHAKDIVHCNLRAKNVWLTTSFIPKIHGYTNNIKSIGRDEESVRWDALEVLNGEKCAVTSDVWSFGVTIWEITSAGDLPYGDLSSSGGQVKDFVIGHGRLERPETCSPSMFSIMRSCWNINGKMRPDFNMLQASIAEKQTENAEHLIMVRPNTNEIIDDDMDIITSTL